MPLTIYMCRDRTDVGDLIRAARAGEPDALNRLIALYRNYLRLLARTSLDTKLQAKLDASDAVQETLLKAFQGFTEFRGESEPELAAWLRRILRNSLANLQRGFRTGGRRAALERSLDDTLERSSFALNGLVPAAGPSPSRGAQQRELGVLMADALASLRPDDGTVLLLRSIKGLDWKEVGHHMDRTPDASRVLWGRALRRLGTMLEDMQWPSA